MTRQNSSEGRDQLTMTEGVVEGAVVLGVAGIVDMAAAPDLADRLRTILRRRPAVLVIDLLEVSFLSSAGMSIVMEVDRRCRDAAASCRVVAEGPVTLRPMQLLGIDDLLEMYPTVVAALRGNHAHR